MASWFAIYAPPGTPTEIITKFNGKCNEITRMPEWKAKMQQVACLPVVASVEETKKYWDDDVKNTTEVIKAANIKLE